MIAPTPIQGKCAYCRAGLVILINCTSDDSGEECLQPMRCVKCAESFVVEAAALAVIDERYPVKGKDVPTYM
jgi:hypothetical protein